MSKRFAIIEENLVVNVVLADDDSLAKENETWVDITEYISHIPAIGWSYTNNKFCKSPSALALREDSVTYKIKTSPLLENQTLSFGDWIYQGNSYDKFVFSGFVKSYDANTRFLLYYDKEGSINPNVAISTVNFDFTLETFLARPGINPYSFNSPAQLAGVVANTNQVLTFEKPWYPAPIKIPAIITKLGFRMRMTNLEYAGILESAKTDSLVQAWVETFNMMTILDLENTNVKSDMEMLVEKGLITPDRSLVILNKQIQPNEMP